MKRNIPTFNEFLNESVSSSVLKDAVRKMDEWFATYKRSDFVRDAKNQYIEAIESEESEAEKILDMKAVLSAHTDVDKLKKIVGSSVNLNPSSPFWKDLATEVIKENK
jgi:metal-responsive CopG/Arc/MetJ family transcriptional regulator